MSLFDNRTDTEKELENYHKQKNNPSDRPKSPFDLPEGYNNNNAGRKSPFDIQNNYNQNNYNQPNGNMQYNANNYINQEKPQNNYNQSNGNMQYNKNNYANRKNNSDDSISSNKGGCFLVIWFIVSIIAMIVLSEISIEWTIIIFGQLFVVFGIFAMFAGGFNASKAWVVLFPIIGLALMGGGIISLYGTEEMKTQLYNILPILGLGLVWVIGLVLIVVPIYTRKVKEKRCTLPVKGVIADIKQKWSRGSRGHRGHYVYAPVYEYIFNGTLYRQESDVYTNYENFDIGSEVTIFLNPSNPNDYYVKRSQMVTMVVGIMFLAMASAFIAVYIITGG